VKTTNLIEIEPPIQLLWWFYSGAIGVDRMDFMLRLDSFGSILSRGWTDFTLMEAIFSPPVHFEVRRLTWVL